MQSFENTPTSPTKRLGVSLNVDTGYKGRANELPTLQTPAAQPSINGRGNIATASRALRVRTGLRETFLDDITPIDRSNKEHSQGKGRGNRDSHDLQISPRQVTRDSLVDHMLLSLDQFSFGRDGEGFGARNPTVDEDQLYTSFGDEESSYQPTQNFAPRNGRGVGQHSYSYSSDYENADDSSRYSPQLSRGRRSNSSSNFQSGLERINSIRNETAPSPTFNSKPSLPHTASGGIHSRGGRGSKGSSANSLDLGYTQATSNQRLAHGVAGRSSSFDYGADRQLVHTPSSPNPCQVITNIPTYTPYDYDAAPNPTVPVGPRRVHAASPIIASHQEPVQVDPSPHKLERKRSTRSSKSAYKGKGLANLSSGGRLDYKFDNQSRELPPLPAFVKAPAPAPLVGYEKMKEGANPNHGVAPPSKDKPGFFRRVFGSSRNNLSSAPEPPRSHGSTTSNETAERPSSKPLHIANQIRSLNTPSPREPPQTPKDHPHLLTKKPSSFFRRRKKSVSEPGTHVRVPMVPPVKLPPEKAKVNHEPVPSPVSSLRKVMNPYLRSPVGSPADLHQPRSSLDRHLNDTPDLDDRNLRGFSPDYEPGKGATIRAVKPSSRDTVEGLTSPSVMPKPPGSPTDSDPGAYITASKSTLIAKDPSETVWLSGPKSPSPSVARDMALVAEYERVHSKRSPTAAQTDSAGVTPKLDSPISATGSKSSNQKPAGNGKDEEWVVLTPSKPPNHSNKDDRVWLESMSSEEDLTSGNLSVPPKDAESRNSGSTDTEYKSATSLPTFQIEGDNDPSPSSPLPVVDAEPVVDLVGPVPVVDDISPTVGDRERAKKIYDGNEDFIQNEKAAAWMGEDGPIRMRTLFAYMELYDFANLNILAALRIMCGRLVLRAESQQVDRILDAFATRWCQCNPDHGFKVTDVVHTICYSILLLNTDLYLADIDQKMTRSQFVKNTMPTIRRSVAESAPDAFEPNRPTVLPGISNAFPSEPPSSDLKPATENNLKLGRPSADAERPSWRYSFKPPIRAESDLSGNAPTPLDYDAPVDDCGPLVKAPFHGTLRTWEVQVEIVLKDFYMSIRNERLPLFGAPVEKPHLQATSTNSLAVFANGMLRRTPSLLSKAPSEPQNHVRGRGAETTRVGTGKWSNKNRSRPRIYHSSGLESSRTSLDDQSSLWSPSVSSSTWSKYSFGKTQTSMSVDSLGSNWPQGDYQQSIGFANALSQAIIREETVGSAGSNFSDREELRAAPLLEDESLELAGAPWAKEGILKHKHHLESLDKKAKDRNWTEVFAVVEKGYMSLFLFPAKSMRNKAKTKTAGAVVGGGNWQNNAECVGSFQLRQTIASALPSPGYSRARPHVWALSLPTGAVHLFQVGTPEIVKEFVSSANYWSARLSNHPLVGGISNIEYGWSDNIVNKALVPVVNDHPIRRPSTSGARPSIQSSLRSSLDLGYGGASMRSRLPGDRVAISDWTPPTQSMRASNLLEPDQLRTLLAYVAGIEEELQKHNQLRSPMLLAFTPRHPNSSKAMANWERKSSYLLREIVKFRTYIDCLQAAEVCKQKIYAERATQIEPADPEAVNDADETLMA